jgi:hypothetical protein
MEDGHVQPVDHQFGFNVPKLNYRDSIIFCLGITDRKYTKQQLFRVFASLFGELDKNNLINFYMPSQKLFNQMINKLISEGIIEERYSNHRYILQLSSFGSGVFDVIQDTLKQSTLSKKIYKIHRLYREYPAY